MRKVSCPWVPLLVLAGVFALAAASGCDEASSADADSRDDADGATGDMGGDTSAALCGDDSVGPRPVPTKSVGEACIAGTDSCERGSVCVNGSCRQFVGCAYNFLGDGFGCVITERNGGLRTEAECGCDAECESSPHGGYCVLNACQVNPPCDAGACAEGSSCFADVICLAE